MRTPARLVSTALILSAFLLVANDSPAMDIIQFDQMTAQDRQAFLNFLSIGPETVLEQEDHSADASKVHNLFNDVIPGDALPIGEAELEGNLANGRVRDAIKHIQNPAAPRVLVEAPLVGTLSKNGVAITPDFVRSLMQLTGAFHRQSPPQNP
jgi:hypothetical protein